MTMKLVLCAFGLCLIKSGLCANNPPIQNDRGDNLNTEKPKEYPTQAAIDANELHEAVKGLGTDDDKIIGIITQRTNAERQLIRRAYADLLERDLIKDLKGDLSGHYESVVVALMLEPVEYAAKQFHKYLTSITSIVNIFQNNFEEMLCTKSGDELKSIKEMYKKLYNVSLQDDLEFVNGDKNKEFLEAIIKNGRKSSGIDVEKAKEQVKLIPDGPGNCSSNEYDKFLEFLAIEDFEQIQYVTALYERTSNHSDDVEHTLINWCDDAYLVHSYLTVVRYAKNPVKYYAEELFDSMIGLGTRDDELVRIIVTRSENDLYDIKKEYENLFNRTLVSSVEADTSGHYKTILVKLIERAQPKPQLDVRSRIK